MPSFSMLVISTGTCFYEALRLLLFTSNSVKSYASFSRVFPLGTYGVVLKRTVSSWFWRSSLLNFASRLSTLLGLGGALLAFLPLGLSLTTQVICMTFHLPGSGNLCIGCRCRTSTTHEHLVLFRTTLSIPKSGIFLEKLIIIVLHEYQ